MSSKQDPLNSTSPLSSREGTPQDGNQETITHHQYAEAARENLESLNISNRSQSQGEAVASESHNIQDSTPDEDVVMAEAPAVSESSKKRDPVLVLKKVIARRDSYFNLYTGMVNTEASDTKAVKHLEEIRADPAFNLASINITKVMVVHTPLLYF